MAFRSLRPAASSVVLALAFLLLGQVIHLRADAGGSMPAPAGGLVLTQSEPADLGTLSIGFVQYTLSATGGGGTGTYVWSVVGGALPPGVSIRTDLPSFFPPTASAGLIGVATTPGTYTFTLRVTSNGEIADQQKTMTVTALRVRESGLPDAYIGASYNYSFTALGAAGPVT